MKVKVEISIRLLNYKVIERYKMFPKCIDKGQLECNFDNTLYKDIMKTVIDMVTEDSVEAQKATCWEIDL